PGQLLLKDPKLLKAYEEATQTEGKVHQAAKQLEQLLYGPIRARLSEEARKNLPPKLLEALNTPAGERTAEQKELAKKAERELVITNEKLEKALGEEDRKLFQELQKKISRLEKELQTQKPQTWGFYSPVTSPHRVDVLPHKVGAGDFAYEPEKLKQARPRLLERGDVHHPGADLKPGWPVILGTGPTHRKYSAQTRKSIWTTPTGGTGLPVVWKPKRFGMQWCSSAGKLT